MTHRVHSSSGRLVAAWLLGAAALLAGCQDGSSPAAQPPTGGSAQPPTGGSAPPTSGPVPAPSQCPTEVGGPVGPASVLVPVPSNGLPASDAAGEPLVIEAIVLDAQCLPVAGAHVNVHHTDSRGLYGPDGEGCCYYQGVVSTDQGGRFRLETIRPAQYPVPNAPAAHIRLEIRHGTQRLTTEIVFAGDPKVRAEPEGGTVPVTLVQTGTGSGRSRPSSCRRSTATPHG